MQSKEPYLFLKRLLITSKQGNIAYDELFHEGVNIIRGVNSTGKSTISNFIFFALGGDFNNWTREAYQCEYIFAEVEINGKIYTFKREVSESVGRPLSIFWGGLETSKTSFEGWQTYPYKQTENQISFSTVLFGLLNFPEVRSNEDNKITIHQVLRLLYIDQDSPVQSLFKFERFDQHTTREAIAELLLGIYDDTLYNYRLELRAVSKSIQEKKSEFESISAAFKAAGNTLTVDDLDREIRKHEDRLTIIDEEIKRVRDRESVTKHPATPLKIQALSDELSVAKKVINTATSNKNEQQLEIDDSLLFIEVLEKRLKAIDESDLVRSMLGDIPLNFCPKCLTPLTIEAQEGSCDLCHQKLPDNKGSQLSRMRQEIALQIRESNKLIEIKRRRLDDVQRNLQEASEKARAIQREIDLESKSTRTTRDERIDTLLQERGGLISKIEYLYQQHKVLDLLQSLTKEIAELTAKASTLNSDIFLRTKSQDSNRATATTKIYEYTKTLLKEDLKRQEEFENPKEVEVDFANDVFKLDGNYNFSASSNIYFKNSVRYSLLYASLDVSMMRYPRFILCDNMEDKGMEKIRTQNFQNIIAKLSAASNTRHQIIFSTSMVSDQLNIREDLCIGGFYTKENKTLKL